MWTNSALGFTFTLSAMSGNQVACKDFLNQCCQLGTYCRFSHNLPDPFQNLRCHFFARGRCVSGEQCRFSHASVTRARRAKFFKRVACKDFLNDRCRSTKCRFSHTQDPCAAEGCIARRTRYDQVACKNFLNHRCYLNERCKFSHNLPDPFGGFPCRFDANVKCSAGNQCRQPTPTSPLFTALAFPTLSPSRPSRTCFCGPATTTQSTLKGDRFISHVFLLSCGCIQVRTTYWNTSARVVLLKTTLRCSWSSIVAAWEPGNQGIRCLSRNTSIAVYRTRSAPPVMTR